MSHCCHNDAHATPELSAGACCSTLPRRPVASCCSTPEHHGAGPSCSHHEGHHDHHDVQPHHPEPGVSAPPLRILDERLARGEMTIEDYTARKAILAP